MKHFENEDYNSGPPFNLECNMAHLQSVLASGLFGVNEIQWLNDNVPLFDTGIYNFKADDWYPLACELAKKGIRKDLWAMCCNDFQFTFTNPLQSIVKFSDASEVRELVTNWFFSHQNKKLLPKWNPDTQELHAVPSSLRIKPEHIYAVLNAFATPELVAEVHRGIAINQGLGIDMYTQIFKEPSDTWRFTSWILSSEILGRTKAVDACETFDIPNLEDSAPSVRL